MVTKNGKTYTGMVSPRGDGSIVVLQASGEKVSIAEDDVAETRRTKVSSMPEGLLNQLSLEDVADLFAYLSSQPQTRSELTRKPTRPR